MALCLIDKKKVDVVLDINLLIDALYSFEQYLFRQAVDD